jgi:hypothetical protein
MRIYIKRDRGDSMDSFKHTMHCLNKIKEKATLTVYLLGYEDREWDDYEQSVSYLAEIFEEDGLVQLRRVR